MTELYKAFPPRWGHLQVPTSSRAAALAGLALYAPCRPAAVWVHRVARAATALLGPGSLPQTKRPWQPPFDLETWSALKSRWHQELGAFDSMAIYQRPQAHRSGLAMLLILKGSPLAFLRIRQDGERLRTEARVLDALCDFGPRSFSVRRPRSLGQVGGWHYLATTALPPRPHRVATNPPLEQITREIGLSLASLPRPEDTPAHWIPMHGDLTPWNLRQFPDGSLHLIDWEDADWGPPEADRLLYEATAAALSNEVPQRSVAHEALAYWEARLEARPAAGPRESLLKAAILERLAGMRDAEPEEAKMTSGTRRPRILVFAYACEPGRGSEPGAGWGVVRALSEFADCTVLVGPEHLPGIRRWAEAKVRRTNGLRFVEVPEPRSGPLAKWHRLPWFLLYLAWLRRAHAVALRHHAEDAFDATYHATYSTYWLPTPAVKLDVPCIWGPVGGAVTTPLRLWGQLGWQGLSGELLDLLSVRVASLLPATRRTWRQVEIALIQNSETWHRLSPSLQRRSHLLNHVTLIETTSSRRREPEPYVLFASALESRKGPSLALRALARTPPEVRMLMAGDGPERRSLRQLARRLGVEERVAFLGAISRGDVLELMSAASAVVFTGLREEGGVALAEAMLCGAPVVVLANGGARTVASSSTDPGRVELVPVTRPAVAAEQLAAAMTRFVTDPVAASGPTIDQEAARRELRRIVYAALGRGSRR